MPMHSGFQPLFAPPPQQPWFPGTQRPGGFAPQGMNLEPMPGGTTPQGMGNPMADFASMFLRNFPSLYAQGGGGMFGGLQQGLQGMMPQGQQPPQMNPENPFAFINDPDEWERRRQVRSGLQEVMQNRLTTGFPPSPETNELAQPSIAAGRQDFLNSEDGIRAQFQLELAKRNRAALTPREPADFSQRFDETARSMMDRGVNPIPMFERMPEGQLEIQRRLTKGFFARQAAEENEPMPTVDPERYAAAMSRLADRVADRQEGGAVPGQQLVQQAQAYQQAPDDMARRRALIQYDVAQRDAKRVNNARLRGQARRARLGGGGGAFFTDNPMMAYAMNPLTSKAALGMMQLQQQGMAGRDRNALGYYQTDMGAMEAMARMGQTRELTQMQLGPQVTNAETARMRYESDEEEAAFLRKVLADPELYWKYKILPDLPWEIQQDPVALAKIKAAHVPQASVTPSLVTPEPLSHRRNPPAVQLPPIPPRRGVSPLQRATDRIMPLEPEIPFWMG